MEWFKKLIAFFDFNKDGKVDSNDAKAAAEKVEVQVEKVVTQAKAAANKVEAKVESVTNETKRRARRVKEEAADVVAAVKEVGNQAADVVSAAKGKSRSGRKPAAKKPTTRKK